MAFGNYKTFAEVIRALQVTETHEQFVQSMLVSVSDYFRSELEFTLATFAVESSEWAVCENLIYPVLREAIKPYIKVLGLWSHVSLYRGEEFLGVPDYFFAKRSPLSINVMDTPLAMIMEAKRNDFDAGWCQCLAAMDAAQIWRFGKLRRRALVRDPRIYSLSRLDELFAALNSMLELCKQQVMSPAEAA